MARQPALKDIQCLFTDQGLPRYYVGFEVENVWLMDLVAGTILVEYTVLVDWWDQETLVENSKPAWTFRRCVAARMDRTTERYKDKAREKHTVSDLKKYRKTEYGAVQLSFDPALQYFPFDTQQVEIEMEFASHLESLATETTVGIRGCDFSASSQLRTFITFVTDRHWAYRPLKSYESTGERMGALRYATYPCVVGDARRFRTYNLALSYHRSENEIYAMTLELQNDPSEYRLSHHFPYVISGLFILLLRIRGSGDATTSVALSNAVFNAGYYLASNPNTTNNRISLVLCWHLIVNLVVMLALVAGFEWWHVLIFLSCLCILSLTAYSRWSPRTSQPENLKSNFEETSAALKAHESKEVTKLREELLQCRNYTEFMLKKPPVVDVTRQAQGS
eukprot:CAMPEP_0197413688 /NCGR_PEP_ID=MMETSP1170-20131217/525_1 /TAXON_ID=54406 /ORGANISM="Sarcinochrysis sp, Strain CCMP770" /LENGTH=392 /DNA_ID=CAMNT_0042940309 /DNA_START=52 /DNA_END=1230 /DNA_ORIENTATION=+